MKAELEVMVEQGEGVIINNASVVGHRRPSVQPLDMLPVNTALLA